jgi:hypothetical protein
LIVVIRVAGEFDSLWGVLTYLEVFAMKSSFASESLVCLVGPTILFFLLAHLGVIKDRPKDWAFFFYAGLFLWLICCSDSSTSRGSK